MTRISNRSQLHLETNKSYPGRSADLLYQQDHSLTSF